jgi:hypothetical protein
MVRYRFGHVGVDDISTCEFPFNGDAADLDRASQCMTLPADERQNDVVKTQEHCVREIDVAFFRYTVSPITLLLGIPRRASLVSSQWSSIRSSFLLRKR